MDTSHPTRGGRCRRFRSFFAGLLILGLGGLSVSSLSAAGTLLVLHSYHSGYWWTDDQAEGIRFVVDTVTPPTETRLEFLDLLRYDRPEHRKHLFDLFRIKYAQESIAVVLTTDEPALKFAVEFRKDLFPDASIVFSGLQGALPAFLEGQQKITGVSETRDPNPALAVIRRFHPDFTRALVIYDPLSPLDVARIQPDLLSPAEYSNAVPAAPSMNARAENGRPLNRALNAISLEASRLSCAPFRGRLLSAGRFIVLPCWCHSLPSSAGEQFLERGRDIVSCDEHLTDDDRVAGAAQLCALG